nr:MAG TPA: hypothetical protein [Bacteriophage sp.]
MYFILYNIKHCYTVIITRKDTNSFHRTDTLSIVSFH